MGVTARMNNNNGWPQRTNKVFLIIVQINDLKNTSIDETQLQKGIYANLLNLRNHRDIKPEVFIYLITGFGNEFRWSSAIEKST